MQYILILIYDILLEYKYTFTLNIDDVCFWFRNLFFMYVCVLFPLCIYAFGVCDVKSDFPTEKNACHFGNVLRGEIG